MLLAGTTVGRVTRDARQRLRFTYDSTWRVADHAIPLSLSMPLAAAEHDHERIEAFLWGLLPDNPHVLERWSRQFQVSARNPFALLTAVGEDCAGAVQFVVPERVGRLEGSGPLDVDWLTEHQVADRLRALRADHAAWRLSSDAGQFSLAGAQAKTALFFGGERWGIPAGRTPTTHILKPPIAGLDGHAENEHFCLALARELGLPTVTSRVTRFEGEVAVVLERYDRYHTATLAAAAAAQAAASAAQVGLEAAGVRAAAAAAASRAAELAILAETQPVLRLHQEDLCQALGVLPLRKYQNEGGPTPQMIVELLRTHSARPVEDVATFLDALIFNWLIAGTDGHAKNYSVLFMARSQVRLAPLYDLGSALPYSDMDQRRLTLAMKTGSTYRVREVAGRDYEKLAATLGLDPKLVVLRAEELAVRLRERVEVVRDREQHAGLAHPLIDRLVNRLKEHAERCLKMLGKTQ